MLVADILGGSPIDETIYAIKSECSQFLRESKGLPVYRALPKVYNTFHKVKVRHHKRSDSVSEAFNSAFSGEAANLVPRGVFAQSVIMEATHDTDPFYVFPINGYRYFYSKGVQNSNLNFRDVMETLQDNISGAFDITRDLIKYTYTNKNLAEGIQSDSEVIFFNIPYFYAVRVADFGNYNRLINR